MNRTRYSINTRSLAWIILGLVLFVYLSIYITIPDIHSDQEQGDSSAATSQTVKDLLEACRSIKHQIESSEFPFPETQYSKSPLFLPPNIEMLRTNKKHKISICVPYKAGSETWRYLMESLTNSTVTTQSDLQNIDQIKDYVKAVQVRDPYERLLSAYRFIFSSGNVLKDNNQLNKHLMEYYDHLEPDLDSNGKPVASFAQFMQSIVTGFHDLPPYLHHLLTQGAALHWLPFYIQCNPCHPSYLPTSVINISTWNTDTQTFLNTAGINTNRTFYLLNGAPGGHSSDPQLLRQFYSQLDREVIDRISQVYHIDFTLFNFNKSSIYGVLA